MTVPSPLTFTAAKTSLERRITADTALRLGRYFCMSPHFWLGLQMDYDLDTEKDRLADRLELEVRVYADAS